MPNEIWTYSLFRSCLVGGCVEHSCMSVFNPTGSNVLGNCALGLSSILILIFFGFCGELCRPRGISYAHFRGVIMPVKQCFQQHVLFRVDFSANPKKNTAIERYLNFKKRRVESQFNRT